MNVIDLEKERQRNRYACQDCATEGKVCPDWIHDFWNDNESFRKLDIDKKLEWFRHTRHYF